MLFAVGGTFSALYWGIQARRTRTASSDLRKQMVKEKYGRKHFYAGAGLLAFWVMGSLIGMAATYILYGKLFFSPHLIGGLGTLGLASIAVLFVPLMQQGKEWARIGHITIAVAIVLVSLAQTVTGIEIILELVPDVFYSATC